MWTLPMVAANFISHIAWHHYYTVLVVPYALALALAQKGDKFIFHRRLEKRPNGGDAEGLRAETSWARGKMNLSPFWLRGSLAVAVAANWLHYAVHPFCRLMGILMLGSLLLLASLSLAVRRDPRGAASTSP